MKLFKSIQDFFPCAITTALLLADGSANAAVIACPADIVTTNDLGQCSASVAFKVTATGAPTPGVTCPIGATVITSPHVFPIGTNTVNCIASNSLGTASCSFTVTVIDSQPPTILCPSDLVLSTDPGQCSRSNVTFAPIPSDNCSGTTFVSTPPSGSTFPIG